MGKTGRRDWTQTYAIYGMDDWQTPAFLLLHAVLCSILSLLLPPAAARFAAGFTGSVTALSAVCLLFAAAHISHSAVSLRWEMSQRIVAAIHDWSSVRHALDVGCGRGILLNAVAMQLKKEGSSGRVVRLDRGKKTTVSTLRTAGAEGVQEYVTRRYCDGAMK